MVSPPPPKRRPPRRGGSPRRTGWATSSSRRLQARETVEHLRAEAEEALEAVRRAARGTKCRPSRPRARPGRPSTAPGPAWPRPSGAKPNSASAARPCRKVLPGCPPARPRPSSASADAEAALEDLAPAPDLESRLLEERTRVAERRAAASEATRRPAIPRPRGGAAPPAAGIDRRRYPPLDRPRPNAAPRALEDLGERLERAQEEHQRLLEAPDTYLDAPPRPDGRDRRGRSASARRRPTASRTPRPALAETDRTARAALEALSAAREARAGSQARHEAAVQRLSRSPTASPKPWRPRRPD